MGLFPAGGWSACSPLHPVRCYASRDIRTRKLDGTWRNRTFETAPNRARAIRYIESALRTLEAEAGGITALAAAIRDGLGGLLHRRGRTDPRRQGPRHRHRHGQVRPRRAQDRGDAGLHRNAGVFRASRRGQPRRSRHDHARRRHHGAVVVGRNRRAQGPDRLFAALPDRPGRHHRGRRRARSARPPMWRWCCRRRARPARTISRRPPPR